MNLYVGVTVHGTGITARPVSDSAEGCREEKIKRQQEDDLYAVHVLIFCHLTV